MFTSISLSEQIVQLFLNKLTTAQQQLLQECDRAPYFSPTERTIILTCSKPWLPLAIEQQDGILNSPSAQEMGISVRITFAGDRKAEAEIRRIYK